MPRGGPRKNAGRRPGEGTKYGETTKPMRVPVSMVGDTQRFLILCSTVKSSHPSIFRGWLERLFEAFTPKPPDPANTPE